MTGSFDPGHVEYARVLERNLKEVADELRAIDVLEMINFVQSESFSAIEDLLQSSTELFFRDGTLTFAWSAGLDLNWEQAPIVNLGMEFRHDGISVFFELALSAFDQAVTVAGIFFENEDDAGTAGPHLLAEALAKARLPMRQASR